MAYKELGKDAGAVELALIKKWKSMDLLKRSIEEREGQPNYIFYDGPPTANGKPGVHHVVSRTLKDMTCRYKTMTGHKVRRKAGWDTHGLPVEIEVEKELGFSQKQDIEDYGVEKFNKKCRESVFKYRDLWMEMSDRMAFLADMDKPYITLDNNYIESVWNLMDDFFNKGLVYKGAKILPYCPRCGTGLASHEVAQGYKEDKVTTVYAMFPIKGREKEYFLAWTTTPWTLLSNVSLTVNPEAEYARVRQDDVILILAKDLIPQALNENFGEIEILETMKGKDLEFMEYEQILPFIDVKDKAFFVTCADYVTLEDGTGVVHTAPAFGEDDYNTGRRYNLPLVQPVGDDGCFNQGPYKGTFVMDADPEIIKYLKEVGRLYRSQKIVHNYPHCWRCHTPLIYYAKPSWYIEASKFRDKMVEENNKVNWFPDYVGEKRFGNWLENLKDWAISRSRYWGTPLNIWKCPDCGHTHSIGSRKQLVEEAIEDIDESIDLHRPYVDRVHIKCPECGGTMQRESDVIDVWFDSGAMTFAQMHYPFEHKDDFDKEYFPADFICEGIDQTRGWFYSLMAISVLYKGIAPYKNVLVNDLVVDKDGIKMSKSKGNTLDPFKLFDEFTADAIRFYCLYVSPAWVTTRFDVDGVKEVNAKFFRTIKNVYQMFALYANTDDIDAREYDIPLDKRPMIDRWLISRYNSLIAYYRKEMEIFEYTKVVHALTDFVVEDLSNWYIRRNRDRFWSSEKNDDIKSVFLTTYEVLMGLSKLIAPITPFLAEELYQSLTMGEEMDSVHLEYIPDCEEDKIDRSLEDKMDLVRKIVNLGRASREDAGIKVRQPLSEILVDKKFRDKLSDLIPLIKEELNIKKVNFSDHLESFLNISLKPNYKVCGSILGNKVKDFAKALLSKSPADLVEKLNKGDLVLKIMGEDVHIDKDYVQINYQAREGYDVSMDGNVSVILETDLSNELINEGFAREFISRIQKRRKQNDYDITDRIKISYSADDVLAKAFEENQEIIAENTLALEIERVDKLDNESEDLNGHNIVFVLERV